LKITSVECVVLDAEYPYAIIHTDAGITGFGECFRRAPYVSKAAIETVFTPLLIGKDPFDTDSIWDAMFRAGAVAGPPGALLTAASGVDIALWDIKGKALGVPLYKLFGGKTRDRIAVYASSLARDMAPEVEARRVAEFRDKGFSAYKMHSAVPGRIDDPADQTIATVKAIRKLVGDDMDVLVDVNGAYSVHNAIEVGKALEDLGVFHFEEPVHVRDLEGLAEVADALDIPIAAGENAYTRWDFEQLLTLGRPDIVQPDVVKAGGITEFQRITSVVSTHGRPMTIHNTQPYGSTAAHVHLIAGRTDFPYAQEYNIEHVGIRDAGSILKGPYEVMDGFIPVPEAPGLGLEYDIDVMRQRDREA
jgi:L-alanine-DL-glutamate epimerase-like enolase superfamily enzyme